MSSSIINFIFTYNKVIVIFNCTHKIYYTTDSTRVLSYRQDVNVKIFIIELQIKFVFIFLPQNCINCYLIEHLEIIYLHRMELSCKKYH